MKEAEKGEDKREEKDEYDEILKTLIKSNAKLIDQYCKNSGSKSG